MSISTTRVMSKAAQADEFGLIISEDESQPVEVFYEFRYISYFDGVTASAVFSQAVNGILANRNREIGFTYASGNPVDVATDEMRRVVITETDSERAGNEG